MGHEAENGKNGEAGQSRGHNTDAAEEEGVSVNFKKIFLIDYPIMKY